MNIYLIRHGTTVWNEEGRTQGRRQNQLSKNGKIVAQQSAEKLKNTKIDIIYTSPLRRTVQTTNIINKYHNARVVKNELLTEIDQGVFSGRLWKTLTDEEKEKKINRDSSCKMETYQDAFQRAKMFVETILKNETNQNILIVSHNNSCSFLQCILNNEKVDFDNYKQLNSFNNGEIKLFKM